MIELQTKVRFMRRSQFVRGMCAAFLANLAFVACFFFRPSLAFVPGLIVGALVVSMIVRSNYPRLANVRVDETGVAIDGELHAAKSKIARAFFAQDELVGPHVHIVSDTSTRITVRDEGEANAILRELAIADAHAGHTVRFNGFSSSWWPHLARIAFAIGVIALGFVIDWWPLLILGPFLAFLSLNIPARAQIFVGTDGVFVKTRFGGQLYRYDQIVSVGPTRRGVEIRLSDGRAVQLRLARGILLTVFETHDQQALGHHLTSALGRQRAGVTTLATTSVEHRLERGDRPLGEWISSLTTSDAASFREAPVRNDDLLLVLDNPAGEAVKRVAAAVLLARRGGDDGRERIRIAAGASAAPRLRIALEAIASGEADCARLEEAMHEVELEARRTAP